MHIACLAGNDLRTDHRARQHARALAAAGHAVTLYGVQAAGAEPEEDDGEVLLVRVPLAPWAWKDRGPAAAWRVARWYERFAPLADIALQRGPPDVFHAFGLDVVEPALAASKRCGARCVLDDPGTSRAEALLRGTADVSMGSRRRAFETVLGLLVRRGGMLQRSVRDGGLDFVVTASPELAADLVASHGGPQPQVVRDCFVPPADPDRARLRARLGVGPREKLIAYRGTGGPGCGLPAAMGALRILGEGHHLVFVGWGRPQEDAERLAMAERVADRLRFLPRMPQDEALEWLAGADVVLIPDEPVDRTARLVPSPVVYECLAAGAPIVASDLPATGAIVRQTGAGVLYPARSPTDAGAVAEALRTVLDDAFLTAACRDQARAAARAELSWARESRTLARVYEALAAAV